MTPKRLDPAKFNEIDFENESFIGDITELSAHELCLYIYYNKPNLKPTMGVDCDNNGRQLDDRDHCFVRWEKR